MGSESVDTVVWHYRDILADFEADARAAAATLRAQGDATSWLCAATLLGALDFLQTLKKEHGVS